MSISVVKAKAAKQAESSEEFSSESDSDKELGVLEYPMRKHNEQAQLIMSQKKAGKYGRTSFSSHNFQPWPDS
jgi:hypothetical protein